MGEADRNRKNITILVSIRGLPRRLARPRDWESYILNGELKEADLVRVERPGEEPIDARADEVPELNHIFAYQNQPRAEGLVVETDTATPQASSGTEGVSSGQEPRTDTKPEGTSLAAGNPKTGTEAVTESINPAQADKPVQAAQAPSPAPGSTLAVIETAPPKQPRPRVGRYVIVGFLAILVVAGFWTAYKKDRLGDFGQSRNAVPTPPQRVTVFTTRDVAVRSGPTKFNTMWLKTLPGGTTLTGTWVKGVGGRDDWLKIDSGQYSGDFVWGGNLSNDQQTAALPAAESGTTNTTAPVAAPPAATPTQPSPRARASFDCNSAHSWAENEVCGSDSLASLDVAMASAYRLRLSGLSFDARRDLVQDQRNWLRLRESCQANESPDVCLDLSYRRRIAALNAPPSTTGFAPPSNSEPQSTVVASNDTGQLTEPHGEEIAGCTPPVTPPSIDGRTASLSDINAARARVLAFISASDQYQTCLLKNGDVASDSRIRSAINANQQLKEQVGAQFNAAVMAYRAMH